ncbi:efflux RND transporter periplasmic adaptor subunit [Chryseobacterium carnipullorum]|uniref:Cation efflux system protein CzcB n=1 Tax=Chryseobacterium carnipullorum TaxID=1124835 RepID=A0A376E107_CHRCU|nr:efflux RND transporter periplasmic adaptor subunit [Chryseobacterium carnipullorum]AZA50311.1 efflux RND transporter periplasmic adaptor subunit [Chryseobacterium carnipullorum]AZA65184.1 efflux RND transporter periplasmic adaptor subunit [Chryseobacterium carnipullorum]STC98400.1 Cation efflux system protein CzcB [Chryseobacterium carnipullorum]
MPKSIQNTYSVLFILTLFFVVQCNKKEEAMVKAVPAKDESIVVLTDAQLRNTPIETMSLSVRNISTVLKINGRIDVPPQNLVSVSVPLGGYLKNTNLLPGMRVNKGQVIAIIENPQFIQLQQDYLMAKSKLHFAELDYNRQKQLNQSQASSDKVMQQAQSEMNSQRIMMNTLAEQLQLVHINPGSLTSGNIRKSVPVYSTINGFVSKVNVNIGKFVNPSDVLFELINPNDIHLNLKVYEKDLQMLKIGQRFKAYTNTQPDKKYDGEIILISKDINADGTADVHCHFQQYDQDLTPGMYMNADIETETSFSNALPEESIVNFEGQDYVFVYEKKQTYKLTPVTLGASENKFIQVKNFKDFKNSKIVTKNAYTLLMKLKNTASEEE